MPVAPIPVLFLEVVYALACVAFGARPGAPLWLSWPNALWSRMLKGAPAPEPALQPRADHAKIERLERELGMSDERPMRTPAVCLIKDCDGDTTDVRTWAGALVTRIHHHEENR